MNHTHIHNHAYTTHTHRHTIGTTLKHYRNTPALCTAHDPRTCYTCHTQHTIHTCTIHTVYIYASYTYMIYLCVSHTLTHHSYSTTYLTCTISYSCYTDPHGYHAWKPVHMGPTYTFIFRHPQVPLPHMTMLGMGVTRFWSYFDKENKAIVSYSPPA